IIGQKCYLVTPTVAANGDDKPGVIGWRLTQHDGTVYDIDATSWSCDCPDATFRGARPGPNGRGSKCRHAVNLRVALQLLNCANVDDGEAEEDAFAGDPRSEWRYELADLPMAGAEYPDEPPQLEEADYFDPADLA